MSPGLGSRATRTVTSDQEGSLQRFARRRVSTVPHISSSVSFNYCVCRWKLTKLRRGREMRIRVHYHGQSLSSPHLPTHSLFYRTTSTCDWERTTPFPTLYGTPRSQLAMLPSETNERTHESVSRIALMNSHPIPLVFMYFYTLYNSPN